MPILEIPIVGGIIIYHHIPYVFGRGVNDGSEPLINYFEQPICTEMPIDFGEVVWQNLAGETICFLSDFPKKTFAIEDSKPFESFEAPEWHQSGEVEREGEGTTWNNGLFSHVSWRILTSPSFWKTRFPVAFRMWSLDDDPMIQMNDRCTMMRNDAHIVHM